MNNEIKRISYIVFTMFTILMLSSSLIQVIYADDLIKNPFNTRTNIEIKEIKRGNIYAQNKIIAESINKGNSYERNYPNPEIYSAVTGYFTENNGSVGLEYFMNDELSGVEEVSSYSRFLRDITGEKPIGKDVYTTIIPEIQQVSWDALGNNSGSVIAMNPKTGEILAMVSKPSYNPNSLSKARENQINKIYKNLLNSEHDPLNNKAINGNLNHPGSTFKLITTVAALESGKYTVSSSLKNTDTYQLPQSNSVVKNAWNGECGTSDTTNIRIALILSCNTVFNEIGEDLGDKKLVNVAEKFGFNESINIPNKTTKSTIPKNMSPPETTLSAIGQQDVMASPIQIAMVSSAIANNGLITKPQLIKKVVNTKTNESKVFNKEIYKQATSKEIAKEISLIMEETVSLPYGSARNAYIEGVRVGGKTGTAENGIDANGENKPYTLWFTGFAPVDNPEVVVAVMVENGGGLGNDASSAAVAAPIGKKVIEAVLKQ